MGERAEPPPPPRHWRGAGGLSCLPQPPAAAGVSPSEGGRNSAHTASHLQELVKEMVQADVELMRNNPNA